MTSTDLITMLNHYFESMSEVIRRFQGTVIEFLGDGIFVVFGAPEEMPLQGSASLAVGCAVEMQNAMTEVNAWNRDHGYPELAMGIGINSGRCVVGNIGSGNRMKYGCMGEAVNLAGRMESLSIGGQINITEDTRKAIPADLAVIGEDSFFPKGGREEMKFYHVAGIGQNRIRNADGEETAWTELPEAAKVFFSLLDGKIVERVRYEGQLKKISADEAFGILETENVLTPLRDLMIRIGDQTVYAKVLEKEGNSYRIGFTEKQGSLAEILTHTSAG